MAQYTDVERLKKHLNIDYSEVGDDDYLLALLNASESRIEKEINQPLSTFVADGKLDAALVYAILIFAATLYASREAVSYGNAQPVPYTLSFLIQPFRKYT